MCLGLSIRLSVRGYKFNTSTFMFVACSSKESHREKSIQGAGEQNQHELSFSVKALLSHVLTFEY